MTSDVSHDSATDATTWERTLDRIEADLERAEVMLTGPAADSDEVAAPQPWVEPQLATPMPAHLHERARDLARRQEALLMLLPRAQDRLRKQQAFTNRVRATTHSTGITSVYIDATA